jgi:hypothetical protein
VTATGAAATLVGAAIVIGVTGLPGQASVGDTGFDQAGNILIADQFNNRIVEVDHHHHIVWSFGDGSPIPGPHSIVGPNDVERVPGGLTLIAGTGTPAGADPSCPDQVNGCPDNRVILVDRLGHIVWQYGQDGGVSGPGFDQLNTPVQATALSDGHVLITDQLNERVIEVTRDHRIVWQYGMTGVTGAGFDQLNNPNSAELLPNGHILIADENNNRVIEVTRDHRVVWSYGDPNDTSILNGTAFASRLPNGDTLITSSNDARIVEVNRNKVVLFTYVTTNRPGTISQPLPTRAVRLQDGDTLISDQFNDQVINVDPSGMIEFTQGQIQTDGTGFDQLNAPYDAKVIGDYTGLTNPANFGDNEG